MQIPRRRWFDSLLAWYFVSVWGSGFIATKVGLQYAPPFTFLTLRYVFGLACLIPLVLVLRPVWPATRAEFGHILAAGLLMHAATLGGSHYAQYLGMSAGVTALILALQPLLTALAVSRWVHTRLAARQWLGVVLGLTGVALVVWHKIDIRAVGWASLAAVGFSLAAITAGTLYQRIFCPRVDLYGAALLQFAISLAAVAPLAWAVEGMQVRWAWQLFAAIAFLVVLASILAVNALHTLMRRGEATRVTSLLYLTPVIAVVLELLMFGVVPSPLSLAGIAITCLGVAMVVWTRRRPAAIATA
ncbi:MAG: DMT family transporter [Burkholderiales bacterium]|nr:DMT family transporter [Burkholderiales bacterium]